MLAVVSLVLSRIDYNNGLLSGLPKYVLQRLQVAQNSMARLVTGTRKREHITSVLRALHWLPVSDRINYKLLLTAFKVYHNVNGVPQYLSSLIEQYTPGRPGLRSATKSLLNENKSVAAKKVGERAFQTVAPQLWNDLDVEQHKPATINTFKKTLKTHLFDNPSS